MNTTSYQQILERDLFPALGEGALAVTATGRLARRMRFRYGQWRRGAGATVWRRPQVLSWQEWMRRLWEESLLRGGYAGGFSLLSAHASTMLWEQALEPEAVPGFDLEQNAALARKSWNLALDYGLNLERLRAEAEGEDERRFARWTARFEELRTAGGWLEPAALPQALAQDLQTATINGPKRLFLLGFGAAPGPAAGAVPSPSPPPQAAFIETLRANGATIGTPPQPPEAASAFQVSFETGDDELQAAARWAGRAQAGIVLFDFSDRAHRARRALLDRMQPAWQTRGFPQYAPLNSAEAQSLGQSGPAEMALDALQLLDRSFDFEIVSRVLRGAYLEGARSESGARANLERSLRGKLVGGDITRPQFMARASRGAPRLAECLQNALKAARKSRGTGRAHLHRTWAAVFTAFLRELGWPGGRGLVSSELQAVEAWNRLLAELGGCDAVAAGPVTLPLALARLNTMARERKFQPQGPDEAVELLSVDEAAGLHFDRLWVAGASAGLWPRAVRPAPLLPLGLQRRLKMPQASPQIALEQARAQTAALLASADEVVFSWTEVAEEGVATTCSPLIASIPRRDLSQVPGDSQTGLYVEELRSSASLAPLREDPAPALAQDEELRGGTRLMDHQLNCPFRAFAEYRLHAREYPRPWEGLSPLDRGSILHKLLHRLYTEHGDAASLNANSGQLRPQLEEWAADIPRDEPLGARPLVIGLLRLERERAVQMALDWAALDRQRGEFRVAWLEDQVQLDLGCVTLSMRLDRVDGPAGDAGALVLDYKTGRKLPLSGLNPDRLRSSQLPAYALATEGVSGVAYAYLTGSETAVVGICDPAAGIPGTGAMPKLTPISKHRDFKTHPDWSSLLAAWRTALEKAARELGEGDARVKIFTYDDSARGQYQVLSRIQELEQS